MIGIYKYFYVWIPVAERFSASAKLKRMPRFETAHRLHFLFSSFQTTQLRYKTISDTRHSYGHVRIRRDGRARPAREAEDVGVRCHLIRTWERRNWFVSKTIKWLTPTAERFGEKNINLLITQKQPQPLYEYMFESQ